MFLLSDISQTLYTAYCVCFFSSHDGKRAREHFASHIPHDVLLTSDLLLTRGLSGIVFWFVVKCRNWWWHKFQSSPRPPSSPLPFAPGKKAEEDSTTQKEEEGKGVPPTKAGGQASPSKRTGRTKQHHTKGGERTTGLL